MLMALKTEYISSIVAVTVLVELALCFLDTGTIAAVASCLCFVGAFEDSTITECKQFVIMASVSCFTSLASVVTVITKASAVIAITKAFASCLSTAVTIATMVDLHLSKFHHFLHSALASSDLGFQHSFGSSDLYTENLAGQFRSSASFENSASSIHFIVITTT